MHVHDVLEFTGSVMIASPGKKKEVAEEVKVTPKESTPIKKNHKKGKKKAATG